MNKQKKIEAMARLDGYYGFYWSDRRAGVSILFGNSSDNPEVRSQLPAYDTDNEIDRMVRGLDDNERVDYAEALSLMMRTDEEVEFGVMPTDHIEMVELLLRAIVATAEQKREAFLRAHGVWEEAKGRNGVKS